MTELICSSCGFLNILTVIADAELNSGTVKVYDDACVKCKAKFPKILVPHEEWPMKNWIVDLGSFVVEARNVEEAKAKAEKMLELFEVTPTIANVIEDE